MRIIQKALFICTAALLLNSARAGLQIPYTPDANTLHLWHFDGPTNTAPTTDEVQTLSITLTNQSQGVTPGSFATLGSASAIAALNTCLQIIPTNYSAGSSYALAVNRANANVTNFCNNTSGAFTFEAILNCTGNPYVANGNWEIVAGDSVNSSRAWQFRIVSGAQPTVNFNFISGGGGNYTFNLPKSGPNIFLQGIWYHIAVTYTGNAPTNGDTAGVMTFYWTLLDGGRTNASLLAVTNTAGTFTLGGTPVIAVGGSARNNSGVANAEGFKGLIDEVRISNVARGSNDLAFSPGLTPTQPLFLTQPPTNTLVGYAQPLTLPALVTGGPDYRWYRNGTLVSGQADSTLYIPSVTFNDAGSYQLIASNSVGMATSVVAQVTIGAVASELFPSGVDSTGALATATSVDTHYLLTQSSDVNNLTPSTYVWNMGGFPIAQFGGGGTFANPDGISQWIGEQAANNAGYTSSNGTYIYRTAFVLDSVDLTQPFTVSGTLWVNDSCTDVLINGNSTGVAVSSAASGGGKNPTSFTFTNNFVAGSNTLDFVTARPTGSGQPESAVRVEISSIGYARAAGIPVISNQPANVTVRESGKAAFSVVALGRPPLNYQWYADGSVLTDATNRTLSFSSVSTGGQGTDFSVIISNDSGSITSAVAVLTLVPTNRPPIPPATSVATYSNVPVAISITNIVYRSTDPDNDPIGFGSADATSANGGSIVQNGITLTYTPAVGYLGADQFNYLIGDYIDSAQGTVNITVLPPPAVAAGLNLGTNIVLSSTGGVPGGTFRVLSSTNLTLPLANWTNVASGTFDGTGTGSVTNPIQSAVPQRFYILQTP